MSRVSPWLQVRELRHRASKCWKVKVKSLSHVRLFATPWTVARQAPLPMGNLPNPGIDPASPALQADSLPSEPPGKAYV